MEKNYEKESKIVIKKYMLEKDLTFNELAKKLEETGYQITGPALQQKINRGKFEFSLYLRILDLN